VHNPVGAHPHRPVDPPAQGTPGPEISRTLTTLQGRRQAGHVALIPALPNAHTPQHLNDIPQTARSAHQHPVHFHLPAFMLHGRMHDYGTFLHAQSPDFAPRMNAVRGPTCAPGSSPRPLPVRGLDGADDRVLGEGSGIYAGALYEPDPAIPRSGRLLPAAAVSTSLEDCPEDGRTSRNHASSTPNPAIHSSSR
jgi:hypothetical protein